MRPAIEGMRIGLCITLGDWPVDADVVANTRTVAEALRQAGAEVEEVELPWTMERIWQAARAHFGAIFGPASPRSKPSVGDSVNDYTRAFVSTMKTELTFYEGLVEETALVGSAGPAVRGHRHVAVPDDRDQRAWQAGNPYLDEPVVIDGRPVPHHIMAMMTVAVQPVQSLPRAVGAVWIVPPTACRPACKSSGEPTKTSASFQVGAAIEAAGFGFGSPDWRPSLAV